MAPGNDSATVFKRNISLNVETYILDFQMLRVLGKIDGARSLAAIAATLNADIADVKATCSRLLAQRLILPTRSGRPSPAPPIRRTPSYQPRPPSAAGLPPPFPSRPAEPPPNPPPASRPPENNGVSTPSPERSIRFSAASKPPLPAPASDDGPLLATAPFDRAWPREGQGPGSFPASHSDIFSIARSVDPDLSEPHTGAFAATPGSPIKPTASAPFFTAAEVSEPAADDLPPLPPEKAEAIDHFEQGLVFLQRSAFEEALRQFEHALRLDPENRLCRANIQRIRDKLNRQI